MYFHYTAHKVHPAACYDVLAVQKHVRLLTSCALQVLQLLPSPLAVAVLKASPLPLDELLSCLPSHLHALAVEASFPSLSTQNSLTLNCDEHLYTTATTVLQTAAARPVRSLHYSRNPTFRKPDPKFLQAVTEACMVPMHVAVNIACDATEDRSRLRGHDALDAIFAGLRANSALSSLEVSTSWPSLCPATLNEVMHLTNLQCLSLTLPSRLWGKLQVPAGLSELSLLTCLRLKQQLQWSSDDLHLETPMELVGCLRNLRRLKVLELSISDCTTPWTSTSLFSCGADIILSISTLPQLTSLALSGSLFCDLASISALSDMVSNLHHFQPPEVGDATVAALAVGLGRATHLQDFSLDMSRTRCSAEGGVKQLLDQLDIAGTIDSCTKLQLQLFRFDMAGLGFQSCWAQLQRLNNIQHLELTSWPIAQHSPASDQLTLEALSSSLLNLTHLQVALSPYSVGTRDGSLPDLAPFIQSVLSSLLRLQHLEFEGGSMSVAEQEALVVVLPKLTSLRWLQISQEVDCRVGDDALCNLRLLTYLSLSCDGPTRHLQCNQQGAAAFSCLTNLQAIKVESNVRVSCLGRISAALAMLPRLRSLHIFGVCRVADVAQVLEAKLTGLEELLFEVAGSDECHESGAMSIASSVKNLSNLRSIEIEWSDPAPKVIPFLVEALGCIKRLQSVSIPCGVGNVDEVSLREMLVTLRSMPNLWNIELGGPLLSTQDDDSRETPRRDRLLVAEILGGLE